MAETRPFIRLVSSHPLCATPIPGPISGPMPRKTAHQIDAEAADWAARLDRGPLSAEQETQFQDWLGQDVRGLGAFGRIRALVLTTERARALGPDFDPAAFQPVSAFPRRRVLQVGGAIAAC